MASCSICNSLRQEVFKAKILNKYEINYFFCQNCGLLQTEEPYWLNEAYTNPIADTDTGLIARNIYISRKLACLLSFSFGAKEKYIDIAGGYGVLTRLMRDIGFDFYWSDLYSPNIFAKGFEAKLGSDPVAAITAFEVLEHVYEPIDFLKKNLEEARTKTIVFSTQLFNGYPPPIETWWYYATETGQHISFFQIKTLKFLAELLSLNLYSQGNFHVLTDKNLDRRLFKILTSGAYKILYPLVKNSLKSKTLTDYTSIKNTSVYENCL